ncbi:MAG: DUF402 domain-containing protein [Hamadaea sp.]|uniref:DUF402 domain-containing protein n=1 Tax=Hamadaea sp. TaxID=2024425 RepID=UPI00182C7AC9|nr:DUF402 domain-containing protein [Hamadaea sp.]NUR72461.1 DUF402 domain-containing protein [Hamadaea sp.]NUT22223.1 DUF402 domain-containing protein [Hamadaea sp.]
MRLAPGREVMVRLVKYGREKLAYAATVVDDDGTHLAVRAEFAGDGPKDLGYVWFEPGDVFTEHYWRDRWYSVKEVVGADGVRKGWYCDICRPAVVDGDSAVASGLASVVAEDLDLDLWRSADGTKILRLDEDEYADSGLAERDPAAAAQAELALDTLEKLAQQGFDELLAF